MPNPLEKKNKSGATVWRVRFTLHGRSSSETFQSKTRAQWFCDQIEMGGVVFALKTYEDWLASQGETTTEEDPTFDEVMKAFFNGRPLD